VGIAIEAAEDEEVVVLSKSFHSALEESKKKKDDENRRRRGREIVGHDPNATPESTVEEANGPRLEDIEKPESEEERDQRKRSERNRQGGGQQRGDFVPDHFRGIGSTEAARGVRAERNSKDHGRRGEDRTERKTETAFGHAQNQSQETSPSAGGKRHQPQTQARGDEGSDVHPPHVHETDRKWS
jgi:hypothetical protein